MDKAAIMKGHKQAPAAPCNLHAVGKQHLGGRCRWCKQDGKVQEKKKYNINGGTDRRTSKFKKVWRVHHMECKRYSLKRGNIDRTKKYMNRNNPSIICVFLFLYWFSANQKWNVLPSWHKTLDTRISTFPGVASSFTPRPANRLEPYVSCAQHITS